VAGAADQMDPEHVGAGAILHALEIAGALISSPFDGARRFRGDIINNAVDAAHLVDDPGRGAAEEFVREGKGVGSHAVGRRHRAQRAGVIIAARIAHDADAADWQQHRKGLPYRPIKPRVADLF
jgi:hypothetical protein